jgi:hypothetical protein
MKNLLTAFAILASALAMTGCAGTPKAHPRTPFIEAEYQKYAQPGNSTVAGMVSFAPFRNPTASYTTSNLIQKVYLVPATTHEDIAVTTGYQYNYNVAPADPRRAAYLRNTVADTEGRFSFSKVPAGGYYIVRVAEYNVNYDSSRRFKIGAEKIAVAEGKDLIDLNLQWAHNDQAGQNASILCDAIDPGTIKASNPMTAVCALREGAP